MILFAFLSLLPLFLELEITRPGKSGLILYSAVAKQKPATDFIGNSYQNPDSVFYSVYYEDNFSINYSSGTQKILPKQFSFGETSDYTLNFIDRNYSIKKEANCITRYKIAHRSAKLVATGKSKIILGIECKIFASYGAFDTIHYYLTSSLPKSAGINILANIKDCVLGVENTDYYISAVQYMKDVQYNTKPVRADEKNIVPLPSESKTWINGVSTEISIGKAFPAFKATDNQNRQVTNDIFKNGRYHIVMVVDYLKVCRDIPKMYKPYFKGLEEQSLELVTALNQLATEEKSNYLVVTNNFHESIQELKYSNLHIVSNGSNWRDKVKILQFPVFVVVDNKGIVKEYVSLFDIDNAKGYVEGFRKLLNTK